MPFPRKPPYAHQHPVTVGTYALRNLSQGTLAMLIEVMPYITSRYSYLCNH
jgi:hypothetical protein